ncbi:hypothetical protein V5O48_014131 [Marasmius crinis-equi]|uniref:ABC transmembrane type-1 domain-containing protein n=1 Tax=Marasmius crinis-equi TaxID=585013 RepID=A0ABR3EY56_9AGAR
MESVSGDTLRDSALIPTYLSVISLAILIARVFWTNRKQEEGPADLKSHIKLHGGPVRFGLECLRFILSIAILCLSFVTGARYNLDFAYIVLLSFIAVITSPKWNGIVVRHVNILLVATFLVYAYRDLFPLATYTLEPQDRDEGVFLWFKVGFLIAASALPLAMPRQYTPVNPEKPSANPSPEQTATLFSLIFFFFMEPVIFAASRVSHLPADQLPPLADYDAAEHLRERIREHIASFNPPDQSSPGHKKRHIFWILLKLVRYEYLGMTVMAMIHTLAKFVVPLALNQLLKFLEKDGEPGFVRPWFWVGMIFVGPNMSSMAIERYMFLALRALIHVDSILCQAIFSHALRIRMKAEADQSTEKKSKSSSSLIGKINNLVTTDVNNILEGPHLPFFFTYIPLQLAASLVFLYTILGWSAFVAFAVTLLFLPVPGYIASLTHRIQKEKMKRTDERVQMVTETTKVMRMVKLFGWEAKMSERIAEKRAEELKWIRKLRFVQVLAKVVK